MSCIGTAGHVDHGKSTLVKALTGIDPDRLAEEKERGMTIDLGFAWLKLPSGREVSIVDVPGHENFIKNMLAGVGGIDVALLVIAADEGIMPQTREHLAILDLLHVRCGVVALTKIDLVDAEWLALVQDEIVAYLQPTVLADAPIVPVSAYTQRGLAELLHTLDRVLDTTPERENTARPRLPIDRVFSLTGFGTVATGTLLDGSFKVGQEVEILPQGIKTRIRSLQTHKQHIEIARPGSRVAMNLTNVARTDLERGNVAALPGQLQPTLLFDARIHLLADFPRPLAHNTLVDFFCGSQEISARVRLLDVAELQPGQTAWGQLRLLHPAIVARHDHFILRIPSPSTTIGGGEIIDVQPRYHRRFQSSVLETLERLAHASPDELILVALDRRSPMKNPPDLTGYEFADIVKQCNLAEDVTRQALKTLLSEGRIRNIGGFWFAQHIWDALVAEALRLVHEQHRLYPLRSGLSKEEWRTRLHLSPRLAAAVFTALQTEGLLETVGDDATQTLARVGSFIRIPAFTADFTAAQKLQVELLLQRFRAHPYTPPDRNTAEAMVGTEIVNALIEQGQFVKLTREVLFLRETYEEALTRLVDYLQEHNTMTAAEARDALETTRKYILPLLEHMDTLHITRRLGDVRMLGSIALKRHS